MFFRSLKKNYTTIKPGFDGGGIQLSQGKLTFPENYISAKKALHHSDVFAAVHLISSDLAAVEYCSSKKQTSKLLTNPSSLCNGFTFWQTIFYQLLLTGNAYARIWGDGQTGRMDSLEFLAPSQVTVNEDNYETSLWYDITYPNSERTDERNVPSAHVLHFRICSLDGKVGCSPLFSLKRELKLQDSNDRFTEKAFSNAFAVNGILEVQRTNLSPESQKTYKKTLMETIREDGVGVIDQFSKYHPIEISQDLAKLLSATDWTSAQIAKAFGIPKDYLGSESEHSNIEMITNLYTTTLSRYLRPIVSELQMKLSDEITPSIRHVLDLDGQLLEKRVINLVEGSVITPAVGQQILLQANADLLTEDILDRAKETGFPIVPSIREAKTTAKGGEKDDEDRNEELAE